ncbi:MAG: ATP-binding protein [Pseudomonadota bacterium]
MASRTDKLVLPKSAAPQQRAERGAKAGDLPKSGMNTDEGTHRGDSRPDWFRSLSVRLLILASLYIVAVLVGGGIYISQALEGYVRANFDRTLIQELDVMIGATEVSEDGDIRFTRALGDQRFFEPYSGWYWQVNVGNKAPFRSRSLWDFEIVNHFDGTFIEPVVLPSTGPDGQQLRIAIRDIQLPEFSQTSRYFVAGDVAEIRQQVRQFGRILAFALGGLGIGLMVALGTQILFGLRPLRDVRFDLAQVREGSARRLRGRHPAEITPLVDEINGLIAHNEELITRARTHAGNLAHALKTPLAVMGNDIEAVEDPVARDRCEKQLQLMKRTIDYHLARARAAGKSRAHVGALKVMPVLKTLCRVMESLFAERGVQFHLTGDDSLAFAGEREDLEEMMGNLMENAGKWARSEVQVRVSTGDDGRLSIVIDDDGSGIPEEERTLVFDRGRRIDETVPGSGLGLAIVADVAELVGGAVTLSKSPLLGGLRACLSLPIARC